MTAAQLHPAADDSAWQAVLDRDKAADGRFVYAVRSTRIFCRPSCPSKRPGRSQVRFYPSPKAAAAEGYRACLRCRPDRSGDPDRELVERATALLGNGPVPAAALAGRLGTSAAHLARAFRRLTGLTPRAYAAARREDTLRTGLRSGATVSSAMYDAGYGSSSRLYEGSATSLGMTPARYRRGGESLHIGYALGDSPLGRVLVAATDRGLCAVSLGDDDASLAARLRTEFPAAELSADAPRLRALLHSVLERLNAGLPAADLPTDVRATAFRRRVWDALTRIPRGETRTYADVAREIGQPAAARAVASACAANPLAVIVPCHRVVRGDGGLGGYRWGAERKRALLEREQALSSGP